MDPFFYRGVALIQKALQSTRSKVETQNNAAKDT